MNRKRIVMALLVVLVTVSLVVLGKTAYVETAPLASNQSGRTQKPVVELKEKGQAFNAAQTQPNEAISQQELMPMPIALSGQEIPQAVVYRHLFQYLAAIRQKGDALEREGRDASAYRLAPQQMAQLTETQAKKLDEIAAACNNQVESVTGQAKIIISNYRAQRGNAANGQAPQAVPYQELNMLQGQRDAFVLQARDRLREAFGADEFAKFDRFVQENIAAKIQAMPVDPKALPSPVVPRSAPVHP